MRVITCTHVHMHARDGAPHERTSSYTTEICIITTDITNAELSWYTVSYKWGSENFRTTKHNYGIIIILINAQLSHTWSCE